MGFNYAKMALTANRLIAKFGRPVTLVQFNKNLVQPDKPWRAQYISRQDPIIEKTMPMVFVDGGLGTSVDKQEFADSTELAGIAAQPTGDETDYRRCDEIVDGSTRYKIKDVQVLHPGPTKLIYIFKIER
jgi:hypothetical protein